MKTKLFIFFLIPFVFFSGCSKRHVGPKQGEKWRAVHLLNYESDQDLEGLFEIIPKLADLGLNVVFFEVDYNYHFKSHPELRRGDHPITKKGARKLARTCQKHDIRLIPEFQCLAHQSWAKETFPLLTQYPHLDLTPGAFPGNEGIYCREWDPLNPEVNLIVYKLMDEIIDGFQADAFHVGMDEVFLLSSEFSPSTKEKDPGEVFAKAVNDIYNHLVGERGVEMLMWGDRLFDGKNYDFGEWESSLNGTASAVDLIPKDIIICPWHYEKMEAYPSIPIFIEKGFRVLPASWRNLEAGEDLIRYSQNQKSPKVLGHLFTIWGRTNLMEYNPMLEGLKLLE